MKLSKAIQILADYRDGVEMEELREYPIVLSLAIGALKAIVSVRPTGYGDIDELLPGETKE